MADEGFALPPQPLISRNPTPSELRTAVQLLPTIIVEINETDAGELLQIGLTSETNDGPWTLINVDEYRDETSPCSVWFEKGWPSLIIELLINITRSTGPLVLVPDTGESPLLISPDSDASVLMNKWEID